MRFLALLLLLLSFQVRAQNCLHFDGTNDYVQTSFDGITGTANRSIEAWIKTSYVATQEVIADYGSMSPLGRRFTFNLIGGKLRCEIGGQGFTGPTNIADNQWHHVAVTYDDGASEKFKLYVDGNLEASFNLSSVTMNTNSTTNFRIGVRVDNANNFIGNIDEVRFWKKALTASEIIQNMGSEFCTGDTNLVAYYKLNEGNASASNTGVTSTYDASGNGSSGTLQNFALSGTSSNWVTGYSLNTTVLTATVSETGCDGSYTSPSGNYTWTTSGTYFDTIQSVQACDSVITINLDFASSSSASIEVDACESYTSPSGFYTYNTSGTYLDTIENAAGCDSVITIDLEILNSNSTLNVEACTEYILPSGTDTAFFSGTYHDTIPNNAGCDSIMVINLTILGSTGSTLNEDACVSYTSPSGLYTWTSSGTYFDTLTSEAGCDSILTIFLTVEPVNITVTQSGNLLSAQATGAAYQWIDCDLNIPIEGATGKLFTAISSGNYAVVVTENGCTDTSDCYQVTVVGMSALETKEASIFPNPSSGEITIQTDDFIQEINIYSIDGTLIESTKGNNESIMTWTPLVSNGSYLVEVQMSEGSIRKSILIIQN